jgi:hypothetical protein
MVVPLTNLVVLPADPTILTDGSVRMAITLQMPPSAGIKAKAFEYQVPGQNTFTVRWTRPNLGKIDDLGASPATYTAPHRIRRPVVRVDFMVTIRGKSVVRMDLPVDVVIVRRNWKIETEVAIDQPCQFASMYSLSWFWNEQGTFSILDNGEIVKDSAARAQTIDPKWAICPSPFYGWTTITPTGQFEVDVNFEYLNGYSLSKFDFAKGEISIYGYTTFNAGGAVLSGPTVSSFVVAGGQYGLGVTFTARARQEGEWFPQSIVAPPITTHRNRIISIDTP